MRLFGFVISLCSMAVVPALYFVFTQLGSMNVESQTASSLRTAVTQRQQPKQSWTFDKQRNWQQSMTQKPSGQRITLESQPNALVIESADEQSRIQKSQSATVFKAVDYKDQPHVTEAPGLSSAAQISPTDPRSWFPVDARSKKCRRRRSSAAVNSSVSLIVDFRLPANGEALDHVADRLRMTVNSLLGGSQASISELLIVGYGSPSSSLNVADSLSSYLKHLQLPSVRVVDHPSRSQAAARMAAFQQSKESIVVFSDLEVVGTVGWLRPLISALYDTDSTVIVQPHFDDASQIPVDYQTTSDRMVVEYFWPLTISVVESNEVVPSERIRRYTSSVVRGNIFAVRRNFFDSIGGYDDQLSSVIDGCPTAAHLELSLRSWMCGGRIETATCSRIGIRDFRDRRKKSVLDIWSAKRIGQLWFGERSNILVASVLTQAKLRQDDAIQSHGRTEQQPAVAAAAGKKSSPIRNCSKIDWYFKEVAKGARVPSLYAVKFGQLRAKAGLCAHINDDRRIDMVDCTLAGSFELTTGGQLVSDDGLCLTVQTNSYVVAEPCHGNKQQNLQTANTELEGRQKWNYLRVGGRLVNPWSGYCAMHVTDPLNHVVNWRQILMAQNCSVDALNASKSFSDDVYQYTLWTFVSV